MKLRAEDWQAALGLNVRALRDQRKASRKELAKLTGIDERYLGSIERGVANPSLKVIVTLALALDTEPSSLVKAPASQGAERKVGKIPEAAS